MQMFIVLWMYNFGFAIDLERWPYTDFSKLFEETFFLFRRQKKSLGITKGQLISKANCQKKGTNEFAFIDLKSCYVVNSNAVRSFFWRIYGLEICFRN
jgi:hypothetical protein